MKPYHLPLLPAAAALAALYVAPGAAAAPPDPNPASARAGQPLFVLYASPASRNLLQSTAADQRERISLWRDLLQARHQPYRIVTQPDQLAAIPAGAVIVAPSAYALDDNEQQLLQTRLAQGDSLLATGLPGSLDRAGKPVPPRLAQVLFGSMPKPSTPLPDAEFLLTVGDSPLTHSLPAGTRLWVGKDEARPALPQSGGAYLSDWSRQPGQQGMLAYAETGSSRRVLLGWPETAWDAEATEFRSLAELALDWVSGRPQAYLATWPWPYQGAATLGFDATWRFENLPPLARELDRGGAAASINLLAPDAVRQASMLKKLVLTGHDVASLGDRWRPFAGQSAAEQAERVKLANGAFNKVLSPLTAAGLRTPEGTTDVETEQAVAGQGGPYLVDAGRVESALPVLSQDKRLVLLPNTLALDSGDGAATPQRWLDSIEAELTRVTAMGGYAYLSMDAAALTPGTPLYAAFARFAAQAKTQHPALWFGSAMQISRWWQEKERLSIDARPDGDDLLVDLKVAGEAPLAYPAAILISPPPGKHEARVEEPVAGVNLARRADGEPTLVVNGLAAGEYRLRLHFQP